MVQMNGLPPGSVSRYYFATLTTEQLGLKASAVDGKTLFDGEPIEIVKAFARGAITFFVQPLFGKCGVIYNFGCALGKAGLGGWALMFNERPFGRSSDRLFNDSVKHICFGGADLVTKSLPGISALIHAVVPNKIEELYKMIDALYPQAAAAQQADAVDAYVPRSAYV